MRRCPPRTHTKFGRHLAVPCTEPCGLASCLRARFEGRTSGNRLGGAGKRVPTISTHRRLPLDHSLPATLAHGFHPRPTSFAVALLHELNPRTPLGSRRLAQTLTLQGHMEWPDMGWLDFFDRELPLLLKHPSMQRHKHDIYTWQLPLRLCRKVLAITLHSAVLDHAVASTFA